MPKIQAAPVVHRAGTLTMTEILHSVTARDGTPLVLTELRRAEAPFGPPFLLVHGFAQNRRAFTRGRLPERLLDRGARVFVAELRGHGRSRGPESAGIVSMATHLEQDLPAFLEEAQRLSGGERIHFGGHSMGGILGYALLATRAAERIASLITFGAPVLLGRGRPLLRRAAQLCGPLIRSAIFPGRVPIDTWLRWATPAASLPPAEGWAALLTEPLRLTNPVHADLAAARELLGYGDPETKRVLLDLLELVRGPRLAGIDFLQAIEQSPKPIFAVIGGRDVIASAACVAPVLRGSAPRRILEVPEAGHVDLTIGYAVGGTVEHLYGFLREAEALEPARTA